MYHLSFGTHGWGPREAINVLSCMYWCAVSGTLTSLHSQPRILTGNQSSGPCFTHPLPVSVCPNDGPNPTFLPLHCQPHIFEAQIHYQHILNLKLQLWVCNLWLITSMTLVCCSSSPRQLWWQKKGFCHAQRGYLCQKLSQNIALQTCKRLRDIMCKTLQAIHP